MEGEKKERSVAVAGGTEMPDSDFCNLREENWLKWYLMHALKVTREQGKKHTLFQNWFCTSILKVSWVATPGYN